MDFNGGRRSEELPDNWQTLRAIVLRRDGWKCLGVRHGGLVCGLPANQVDHIIRGLDHSLENLQSLCEICHSRKTSAEAHAARRERRQEKKKDHPFYRRLNRAQ